MQFIWRLLTGCDWQESRTELRHYYTSHHKRIALLLWVTLGVTLAVRLLNKYIGPIPKAILPTVPDRWSELSSPTTFGFELLLFIALALIMLMLPPVSSYPVDVGRVTLLPRKIYCILLSLPFALSYALERRYNPYFYFSDWQELVLGISVLMLGVIIPTAVLASFLVGFKISWRFTIAASVWVLCHIIIRIVEWRRFPLDLGNFQVSYLIAPVAYALALCACILLVWHHSRWIVFVLGCLLTIINYTLNWSIYSLTSSLLGHAWGFGLIWAVSWFAAGVTGVIPYNWTYIVDVIR